MDQCSEVDTPITKNGQDSFNNGEELHEEEARRARRAIATYQLQGSGSPRYLCCRSCSVPMQGGAS